MYDPASCRLDGGIALITGAGAGIARAIAEMFAGAAVAVTDRDGGAAETVAAAISQAGGRAFGAAVDLRAPLEALDFAGCRERRRPRPDPRHQGAPPGRVGDERPPHFGRGDRLSRPASAPQARNTRLIASSAIGPGVQVSDNGPGAAAMPRSPARRSRASA